MHPLAVGCSTTGGGGLGTLDEFIRQMGFRKEEEIQRLQGKPLRLADDLQRDIKLEMFRESLESEAN